MAWSAFWNTVGNLGRRRRRSVRIGQEKHLPTAARSRLCSSTEERLVLEDEMRESHDFLATDLDLSKGKIGFSIKMIRQFGNWRELLNGNIYQCVLAFAKARQSCVVSKPRLSHFKKPCFRKSRMFESYQTGR